MSTVSRLGVAGLCGLATGTMVIGRHWLVFSAAAAGLDPIGDENLALSKKIRKMALREGASEDVSTLTSMANDFFPLPEVKWRYWSSGGAPLRPPTEVYLPGNGVGV